MILSRTTDPVSSHLAAAEHKRTCGAEHLALAYNAVVTHPGSTCDELAAIIGTLNRVQLGKRLPELANAGRIARGPMRRCTVAGRKMLTWVLPAVNGQRILF